MGKNHLTMKKLVLATFMLAFFTHLCWSETGLEGRRQVVLEGKTACVGIDISGGSIVDFHLIGHTLNPLNWNYPEKGDTKPRPMGHFVCFDRWGQPSPSEEKNGMPFHGEATKVEWKVLAQPAKRNGKIKAEMLCELPIGGMKLKRIMALEENASILEVTEEITNVNKLGRVYNIVQHPTIALPFLDESVIVDCNALKGFMQESPMPTPEEPVLYWPKNFYKGEIIDLRFLEDDPGPTVVSFVFRDGQTYGWVTACNPEKGLLIGYLWKISEYPWLNIWRNVKDGSPAACGMEFGTTGLHKPFGILIQKGKMFNRPLYEYIDAGQTIVKSFTMFLAEIPADCNGVDDVLAENGMLIITIKTATGPSDVTIKNQ